jgi:hypothetical protein
MERRRNHLGKAAGLLSLLALTLTTTPSQSAENLPNLTNRLAGFAHHAAVLVATTTHTVFCTDPLTVCARAMRPSGVPVGGSFTVRIEDHFTSTYQCMLIEGRPRWIEADQQGACAPPPVIFLPAHYQNDQDEIPSNIG